VLNKEYSIDKKNWGLDLGLIMMRIVSTQGDFDVMEGLLFALDVEFVGAGILAEAVMCYHKHGALLNNTIVLFHGLKLLCQ
jgi:hypothetical protein